MSDFKPGDRVRFLIGALKGATGTVRLAPCGPPLRLPYVEMDPARCPGAPLRLGLGRPENWEHLLVDDERRSNLSLSPAEAATLRRACASDTIYWDDKLRESKESYRQLTMKPADSERQLDMEENRDDQRDFQTKLDEVLALLERIKALPVSSC